MRKFICLFAAMFVTGLRAQQMDNPVVIPVSFYGYGVIASTYTEAYMNFGASLGQPTPVTASGPGGTQFYSDSKTARLIPGQVYTVSVTSTGCAVAAVVFQPTAGQEIYIDGKKRTSFTNGSNYTFKLRVEYINDITSLLAGKRGGECSSLPEDKPIWYVGLGTMRNGRFAGAVGFRAADITSGLFNTSSLIYDSIDTSEVTVSRDGNGFITQIQSRDVTLQMDAYSAAGTSYSIRAYTPSNLTTPFATYTVGQFTVSGGNGIRIDRSEYGVNWATMLTKVGSIWTRYDWQRIGASSSAFDSSSITTTTVNGNSSTVNYGTGGETITKVKTFGSTELLSETRGTGPAAQTTSYTYHNSSTGTAWPSAVATVVEPTGNWKKYDYYNADGQDGAPGQIFRIYQPWKDAPTTPALATTTTGRVETFKYANNYDNTKSAMSERTVTIDGTAAGKTTWEYNFNFIPALPNGRQIMQTIQKDFSSSAAYLTTTTLAFLPNDLVTYFQNKPHSVTFPTGAKDSYAYFNGSWNGTAFTASSGGSDRMILAFHGQTAAGTPAGTSVASWTSGSLTWTLDPLYMVSKRSTVSVTVVGSDGRIVFSGESLYDTGSLVPVSGKTFTYDGNNRLQEQKDVQSPALKTTYSYAGYTSGEHSFGETATGADGFATKLQYDSFLRLATKTMGLGGVTGYPERIEKTTYTTARRPSKTYTCSCGTAPTSFDYDNSGRVTDKRAFSPNDPADAVIGTLVTHYDYPSTTVTQTTLPSGATTSTSTYADGQAKSVSGSAQPPSFKAYTVNATGILSTSYNQSSAVLTDGWTETQYDWLGRVTKRSVPAYDWSATNVNNVVDVASTYDATTGTLTKQTTTYRATGGQLTADTVFKYNASGTQIAEGLDVNVDGDLTAASSDRVTLRDVYFEQDGGIAWWRVNKVSTYAVLKDGTETVVSLTKTRFTGFPASVVGESVVTDANGQATTQQSSVDVPQKTTTLQTTVSGISNVAYKKSVNGYDAETKSLGGDLVQRSYDSRGRLSTVKSRYDGTSFTATDTSLYFNDTEFVESVASGGVTTHYLYSWGGSSRRVATTNAVATSYLVYNALDLPWRTYGAGASPTESLYDALGRLTSLTTWRSASFDGASWPATPGAGDLTQWELDPATGLLKKKTDADGKHVDYTYTALGQVKTKISARNLTTTNTYYDGTGTAPAEVSHRTQELKSITYSDGTPSVSFTYKRTGLVAGVSDVAGTRSFAYASGQALRLDNETLGTFYGGRINKRIYDTYGRGTGFQLGTASDADANLAQTGDFIASSGLLSYLNTSSNNGASRTFTYAYKPNGSLVDGYYVGANATANFATSYDYDATSSARRSVVESKYLNSSRTRFDLAYDARGFLQSATQSGSAFTAEYATASFPTTYKYSIYDERGQVKSSGHFRGTPTASTRMPDAVDLLPGRRFEYRYDAMGNRTLSGQVDPDDATISATAKANLNDNYTLKPNGLNQYLTKENKSVRVVGTVAENATVAAQGSIGATAPVAKKDRAYAVDLLSLNNINAPARGGVTVFAALPGQGSGGSDLLSTRQRNWEVPQQTQTMSYDADGNLTGDGIWIYSYDAENRLVSMETIAAAVTAGLRYRLLEFKYDYMGRRVQKRSKQGVFGASPATDTYTGFAYDGWNLVAEFAVDNPTTAPTCGTMLRSYTWGLDVAGSTSATGGIGALVQIVDHGAAKTYFPTYDGSGNLAALVDSADGTLAAVYEYSPYGELLRIEGAYASANPFRFSTKFSDVETGLSYYGHRYYHAGLGRFINRDPIEERGGINLYAFAGNNPLSRFDYLGLDDDIVVLDKFVVKGTRSTFPSSAELYEFTRDFWGKNWIYNSVGITGGTFVAGETFSFEPPKPKRRKDQETAKQREARKQHCAQLLSLMNQWSEDLTATTQLEMGPVRYFVPTRENPMSGSEWLDRSLDNVQHEAWGIVDAAITFANPAGLIAQTVGYIASNTQTGGDLLSGELGAGGVVLAGASAVNQANAVSIWAYGRPIVGGVLGTAAKRAGVIGAVVTVGSVVGGPTYDYLDRNHVNVRASGGGGQKALDRLWEISFQPTLKALGDAYSANHCSDFH